MTLWIAALIWLQGWKQDSSGDGSANLTAKKNWRLTLATNLANRFAMAFHRQQTDLGNSSVVWCFTRFFTHIYAILRPSHWKATIFVPKSLRSRKLRHSESRGRHLPWMCPKERHTGSTCRRVFVCLCVGLHACNTVVSFIAHENMGKILFELKLNSRHFNWMLFVFLWIE